MLAVENDLAGKSDHGPSRQILRRKRMSAFKGITEVDTGCVKRRSWPILGGRWYVPAYQRDDALKRSEGKHPIHLRSTLPRPRARPPPALKPPPSLST